MNEGGGDVTKDKAILRLKQLTEKAKALDEESKKKDCLPIKKRRRTKAYWETLTHEIICHRKFDKLPEADITQINICAGGYEHLFPAPITHEDRDYLQKMWEHLYEGKSHPFG